MKNITGKEINVGDNVVYIYKTGVYSFDTQLSTGVVAITNDDGVIVKTDKAFNVVAECLVVN